jgi:hypothetical protein
MLGNSALCSNLSARALERCTENPTTFRVDRVGPVRIRHHKSRPFRAGSQATANKQDTDKETITTAHFLEGHGRHLADNEVRYTH